MPMRASGPGISASLTVLLAFAEIVGVPAGVRPAGAEEEDHEEDGGQRVILSAAERAEFGIQVAAAAPGELKVRVDTPGEVLVNPDRVAHISPRVPGVAVETFANVGDRVRQDQVLAVLHSRELSELKSVYLVARERLELARTTFDREKSLWDQSISSERLFLEAKNGLAAALIELQAASQKLRTLGFPTAYLDELSFEDGERFTRYVMTAPIQGTVIRKHIVRGEVLQEDSEAFVVADLSSVWVLLTAYQKDLPFLRVGQSVRIEAGQGGPATTGAIDYVSPIVDEATRTASVRVVLANEDGRWRPGSFVTATISADAVEVPLMVPGSAVQILEHESVVFLETGEGFEPHPVEIGRTDRTHAEILSGLEAGEAYVSRGAFVLKAQLDKGAFGEGHAH